MKNLVILPTYNESENINKIVETILSSIDTDVLIIDDNSPDGTGQIADSISKSNPRISVIHRETKAGLGTAYLCGFRHALNSYYENIFTMDSDFSHNPKYLPEFEKMLLNYGLVIGSRYVKGGGILDWPLARRLTSKLGNIYAGFITGLRIKDCTSGFAGIKSEQLKKCGFEKITSEGYCFLIELKWRLLRNNTSFVEFPIIFTDRLVGKSKISRNIIFEAVFHVWKLRFNNKL